MRILTTFKDVERLTKFDADNAINGLNFYLQGNKNSIKP